MERDVELALVTRLREGDPQAFDQIYQHFRPRLFGFLVRMSKHQQVAEDLLQETWIRLSQKAPVLKPDTRLAAWLFTVARNLYLSYRRWRLLDAERIQELVPRDPSTETATCPFELVAVSELEAQLEQALASLPLRYREALLLTAIENMAPSQAAQICELKPETFRKRLSRARAMLSEHLAQQSPALTQAPGKELS